MKNIIKQEFGQSLIEVIIAIGLLAIVFTSGWGVLHNSYQSVVVEINRLKAHYLVVEGLEAVRSIRDEDWNSIADGEWHFEFDDSVPGSEQLVLTSGSELVDSVYTRKVEISSVRRDTVTGKITENPSSDYDPNTKMIQVTVEWNYKGETISDSESIYLTNWARF